jgi:hypothetical protein
LGPLVKQASDLDRSFLPEDGRRSSFRNVAILLKNRRWAMSKKSYYRLNALVILLKYRRWAMSKKSYYRLQRFSNFIKI